MLTFNPHFNNQEDAYDYQQLLRRHQSVLSSVQAGIPEYQSDLGWFEVEGWANQPLVTNLQNLASEIREVADVFVLIGVGGSNNAARSVIQALQALNDSVTILYSGNTLSGHQMQQILQQLEGKSVYLNCIAKNFETLEPGISFRMLRQYLETRYEAEEVQKRIICTGSKASPFETFACESGYRFLEFPSDIGGRYTAMTSVGLLPMAVAGIDIREVVAGAIRMEKQLAQADFSENQAYHYACYRQFWFKRDYRMELLATFEPQFHFFSKWWIQLFAESEGKENQGLYPTYAEYSEDLHAVGQYVQEGFPQMIETFLLVEESDVSLPVISEEKNQDGFNYLDGLDWSMMNRCAFEATFEAHSQRIPCGTLSLKTIDGKHFGALFYFFQYACYLSCRLQGINPFNQPGVEAYKKLMFQSLKKESI